MDKQIVIVRVPEAASDAAIEDALSAPAAHGYYLALMLPPRDGSLRALFRRHASYVSRSEREVDEAKVLELLAANPTLSLPRMAGLLAARGIKRTRGWVSEQRARIAYSK